MLFARYRVMCATALLSVAVSIGDSALAVEPGDPDDPLATVELPDDIVAQKGVEYRRVAGDESEDVLRYDFIRLRGSEKSQEASPLLLFIHGGGWRGGVRESWYRRLFYRACEPLIRKGMAVATIDYRLAGKNGVTTLDSLEDCQHALHYFHKHAARLNLDIKRLAIMGGSAGGHLSLMTALAPGVGEWEGKALPQARICVPYYPLCHFGGSELHPEIMKGATYGAPRKFTPMLGGPAEEKRQLAQFLSPISHLRAEMPAVLLLHGDADPVLPVASPRAFAEKARQMGAPVTYLEVAGGNHGFRTADKPDVPGITRRVTAFLREHLQLGGSRPDSEKGNDAQPALAVTIGEGAIRILDGRQEVLVYHTAEVEPPEGVDPLFRRSGFVHPLRTPNGAMVTGTRPDDHYHHMGLWHAWVKTKHNGRDLDFWNLKGATATVRHVGIDEIDRDGSDGSVGFQARQVHVALNEEGGDDDETILEEKFFVTVSKEDGAYEIDYDTHQTNITKYPLELPAYRYGGPIAYRAPHHWDLSNSDYLSSEGKTRVDGHETRSRWIAMSGPGEATKHPAMLAILCHPENHDFPQRMRVWPPKTHNGAIFFNYVPIQENGWAIEPGQTSVMRYRLVVADEKPKPADLNRRWQRYAEGGGDN